MTIVDFVAPVEFVANINGDKDCLMAPDLGTAEAGVFWFNIDVPKGHGVSAGDRIRVVVDAGGSDTALEGAIADFEAPVEMVAHVSEQKDCLLYQEKNHDDPNVFWFNIDIPAGHGISAGDRVRIIVAKP
ncbi:hypothetical protein FGU65_05990 [Methanoculleus sp. FWC-SCC1]|uniref:DUF1905 domain-containing protein n=1 Tax=Methanoculleus frigidifontis TaxID=2584085 RepID=A0ABT8M927_9EURY|nr:hypothetical protein [Methanoculleus sp. FWC-SCC1]MDN7024442.1 hypothetical protein [Methanoculleus sp. FWC-SCC1]